MNNNTYPFVLPPLPYAYDALEPFIDSETMHCHHDKHFAAYITKLNTALERYPNLQKYTLEQLLTYQNTIPETVKTAVVNNGGGVYNHFLFFNNLSPASESNHQPSGSLSEAIKIKFGSFDNFRKEFTAAALDIFGSGWVCLGNEGITGLQILKLKNQETALDFDAKPIILFDVWEHAYYLKYKNERERYVNALWNIIKF